MTSRHGMGWAIHQPRGNTMSKIFKLDDLNSKKASEVPYTFEFIFDGTPSGIMLSVVGQQSETFETAHTELLKRFELEKALTETPQEFLTSAKGKELTFSLAACRLVGWTGIKEPLTPENAIKFVTCTDGAFDQIVKASNKIGNFIRL